MKQIKVIFYLLIVCTNIFAKEEVQKNNFSMHNSQYFSSGLNENTQVKFQLSFKYSMLSFLSKERDDFYFGFTQKSFWNLWDFDGSSPFEESNYAPEFFLNLSKEEFDKISKMYEFLSSAEYLRFGLIHESNGEKGDTSRSWNRLYLRAKYSYNTNSNNDFNIIPSVWYPFQYDEENNGDIIDYLGIGELSLYYKGVIKVPLLSTPTNTSYTFRVDLRKGLNTDLSKGSILVEFTSQIVDDDKDYQFMPDLYIQYFNGYGQSLKKYNKHSSAIRLGLAFIR